MTTEERDKIKAAVLADPDDLPVLTAWASEPGDAP